MADGYVQVPPDSSGKKIDSVELSTTSGTVERQRVSIPDGIDVSGDALAQILVEQRLQNVLLAGGLRIKDDIEALRDELSDVAGLTNPDVRELLTADRTYYVSTAGSDTADGLTPSTAFLTLQKAYDTAATLDCNNYAVTLQLGSGTFDGASALFIPLIQCGGTTALGAIDVVGADTAGSTILTATTSHTITVSNGAFINLKNLKLRNGRVVADNTWACLVAAVNGQINIDTGVIFDSVAVSGGAHMLSYVGGNIYLDQTYTITAQAGTHLLGQGGYFEQFSPADVIVTGTQAYSSGFVNFTLDSRYFGGFFSFDISGATVTGQRYYAELNSVINTGGGGANFFPGDSAGTNPTGGQYA